MADRQVRVRILLSKGWDEDETPTIVAAIDESIWEHWDAADDRAWRENAERLWGIDPDDCEWREVVACFDADELRDAFATPAVQGKIGDV